MVKVSQYLTTDNKCPYEVWFSRLNAKAAAKITAVIARMQTGNLGDTKSVGSGVWERRIDFEKGYRLYFGKDGNEMVILLCGGTKARQQNDIVQAKEYWADYKRRKRKNLT